MNRFWTSKLVLSVMIVSAIITALAMTSSVIARQRPVYYRPPNGERMLYLAPKDSADLGLQISESELATNGVAIVRDSTALTGLLESDPNAADAVIVHGSRLSEVDRSWLRVLYRRGVVIAGINMTMKELAEFLGEELITGDEAWNDGWQKEPFYSILAFKAPSSPDEQAKAQAEGKVVGTVASSTDNIRSQDELSAFLSLIRRDIEIVH